MKLLLSQKNKIFDLIEQNDYFSPSQFEIVEVQQKNGNTTRVNFKESAYFFKFIQTNNHHQLFHCNYSPGELSVLGVTDSLLWEHGVTYINKWLMFLKRELSAPNKWDRIFDANENITFSSSFDNSKFTFAEYEEVKEKLTQIKNSLGSLNLIDSQQIAISDKLDHLLEAAKDLNKFDWKNLFIGTVISVVIQLGVNKESVAQLWALIKRIFNNFILP